ncbi:MAG TPA: tetratricopeptide repeat protein [Gemmatimonadaceae bacterium]
MSAGLVTMRLVDRWIAVGSTSKLDSWSVSAVREAIAQVSDGTPIRRILTSVVDVMVACTATDMHALSPRLMAYGQALEYDAKWSLAADAYTTISTYTHPVEDADIAIASSLQLGFSLRTLGQLDAAASAYSRAADFAATVGDRVGNLRGRLGDAKIALAKGNFPKAEAVLASIVEEARDHDLTDMRSRALHDRAVLEGHRGKFEDSVRYAYEALGLSPSPIEKGRILTNIATSFRNLGRLDVARDAYLVLAATAQEQYVRWWSEVSLMEIAAAEGNRLQFDRYRRELERADFTPMLRISYLMDVGQGYRSFDECELAIPAFEQAIELASKHGYNRQLFEAEAALGEAKRGARKPPAAAAPELSFEALSVGEAIHKLKEAVCV